MIVHWFLILVYQPFFNILVFFYWLLELILPQPDMGWAVVMLTFLIRILLLPMSLNAHKAEIDKDLIVQKIKSLENQYAEDPIRLKQEKRMVLANNRTILRSEMIAFFIQLGIALMLYRMFATGLSGQDIHLVYDFMPQTKLPFNLLFLGKFDLTHPDLTLNLIQTTLIFILEGLSLMASGRLISQKEFVYLQLILPLVSFFVFLGMPAGKKVFVISSLIFSIVLSFGRLVVTRFSLYKQKIDLLQQSQSDSVESLVTNRE